MGSTDPVIDSYRRGVQVMMSRPQSDPTSWMYQANIHGTALSGLLWNSCEHGNGEFLPWHRMYVYFFERIVRAASGDPSFALPYWDYSQPGFSRLPDAFRNPQTGNVLFNPNRNGSVNAGQSFPNSAAVLATQSMQATEFLPTGISPGFGAGSGSGAGRGTIESLPHNPVHVAIGGDMGHPFTAGQDPIFWLHHCNIDRLWDAWINLGGGRANPTNSGWLNTSHSFFDENGNQVSMTNAEILNTTSMGGRGQAYVYENFGFQSGGGSGGTSPVSGSSTGSAIASSSGTIALGNSRQKVGLQREFGAQSDREANDIITNANQAVLILDDVKASDAVGAYYEVYLNLPDGATPDPNGIHFVGVLDFFSSLTGAGPHGGHNMNSVRYDLRNVIAQQEAQGIFTNLTAPPDVTFVISGMPATSGGVLQIRSGSNPLVGQARIEVAN